MYIKDSSMTRNVDSYVKDSELFIFKWEENASLHTCQSCHKEKKEQQGKSRIVLEVFLQFILNYLF